MGIGGYLVVLSAYAAVIGTVGMCFALRQKRRLRKKRKSKAAIRRRHLRRSLAH